MAGRQGFELGASLFSKVVMARDFWSKRLNHRRLRRSVSFTAVHQNPHDPPPVVETFWRRCRGMCSHASALIWEASFTGRPSGLTAHDEQLEIGVLASGRRRRFAECRSASRPSSFFLVNSRLTITSSIDRLGGCWLRTAGFWS